MKLDGYSAKRMVGKRITPPFFNNYVNEKKNQTKSRPNSMIRNIKELEGEVVFSSVLPCGKTGPSRDKCILNTLLYKWCQEDALTALAVGKVFYKAAC